MLTTHQKESILRRAGIALPGFAPFMSAQHLQQADSEPIVKDALQADCRPDPSAQRTRTIDALFDAYTAHRAVWSLQADDASRRTPARESGWGGPTA